MADEFTGPPGFGPSGADLAWRIDRLQRSLDNVVGRPEYTADKSGTDRRISDLERDLEDVKRSGFARIRDVEEKFEAQLGAHVKSHQDSALNWRSLLWTGALPAVAALLAVFITYWLSHH